MSEVISINEWKSLHCQNASKIIQDNDYLFSYTKGKVIKAKPLAIITGNLKVDKPKEVIRLNSEIVEEEE